MMQSIALRMSTSGSGTGRASGPKQKISRSPFQRLRAEIGRMKESGVIQVTDTRNIPEAFQEKQQCVVPTSEQHATEEKDTAKDEAMLDVEHKDQIQDEEMPDQEDETVGKKDEGKKDEDPDFPRRRLYVGNLPMLDASLKCLIYKIEKPDLEMWNTFCLLKNFRHPAVDTLHTFYEESGQPRVVLSWLDCMLRDLVRTTGDKEMFFTKEGSLSEWFRSMVIDMCSGLEHLFEKNLYPLEITLDDLYVCKDGPEADYSKAKKRIKWLILKVDKITYQNTVNVRRKELWKQARLIVEKIQQITMTDNLSVTSERFIKFIGRNVNMLRNYPDLWTPARKGSYLISIIAADIVKMEERLSSSSFDWPSVKEDRVVPKLLLLLIENDLKRSDPCQYLTSRPYDYVKLCRHTYKHHAALCKEVPELKDMCPKAEDFITRMEKWQPDIWCILYEAIGVPDCPRDGCKRT